MLTYCRVCCAFESVCALPSGVIRGFETTSIYRTPFEVTERRIRASGGQRIYAETSCRPQYESTSVFYERLGFFREPHLEDFYAPGDDKVFYVKVL